MPLYEYRCESCQKEFEAYRRLTDDREEACPACGGRSSRVSISLFRPRGSGSASGRTSCGGGSRRSPFR
ncbi:MAG TPA: zinc ribbon domain-containing protein [Candidatus Deferrimicrobiaceae bacterium]|nr:zinc ribbon domain-containing protein [Candidatus Deferrimicrobiaceae bacterium]